MPRQARLDAPGVLHHVMARGIERGRIFLDHRDRDDFVKRLSTLAGCSAMMVYAWSLMSGYAGYFNRRHRRDGHVFQNRFKSIVCEEEVYLLCLESLTGGGRSSEVSRVRAILSYVWVRYLGRSGRELARELGVSPQAIYSSSGRVGSDINISYADLERWCR